MHEKFMDGYMYPDRYAIEQALGEFWQRRHVDLFAQELGVVITNANQNELAQFLSGILYEQTQLDRIRNAALQLNVSNSLVGLKIKAEDESFDLVTSIDQFRGVTIDNPEKLTVKPLVQIPQDVGSVYKGVIEYKQYKPGRVEFLQGTQRIFDYFIRPISNSEWEVLVDCSRSNDGKLMENWLKHLAPKGSVLTTIDQDQLSTSQTIQFFDELGIEGAGSEWRFTQVKRLVLRRDDKLDSISEDEERIEDSSVLSGITQAILEGRELRDNLFVRQCEEGGYRFSAMTYEYENVTHPYVQEIRAEFKSRPKIFEVSLVQYQKRMGLDAVLQTEILPEDRRIALLSMYWSKAQRVYSQIIAGNSS